MNNVLDDDPATLGKNGESIVLGDGDTAYFAPGTYQLGLAQGRFELRIGGTGVDPETDVVAIQGAGWGEDGTRFIGATPTSGQVWIVYSDNVVLFNFNMRNANAGLIIKGTTTGGADYQNIRLRFIHSIGFEKHYFWDEQEASEPTTEPSITGDNLYVSSGSVGFQFGEMEGATPNTKFLGFSNVTIDGLTGIGIDPPAVWEGGEVVEIKGEEFWLDVIIINTTAPFAPTYYSGQGKRSRVRTTGSPEGFVESENGEESLYALGIGTDIDDDGIPDFNFEFPTTDDLLMDENGAPLPGSPLIKEPYELPDARIVFSKGYIGAVPPAEVPIPTLSEWGLVVMLLVILSVGTLIFRADSVSYSGCSAAPCGRCPPGPSVTHEG